jgi:hypothetical protein
VASGRWTGLSDGSYQLGRSALHVQHGRARAALEQIRRHGRPAWVEPLSVFSTVEPVVAAAPPPSDLADRLVGALELIAGRETPAPIVNVAAPPTPTVSFTLPELPAPVVNVTVPEPPKPKAIRVEHDSAGRRYFIPVEDEG